MNRYRKHFAISILTFGLICGFSGCSQETLEDVAETTNAATDGVGDGQYSADPVDRIAD